MTGCCLQLSAPQRARTALQNNLIIGVCGGGVFSAEKSHNAFSGCSGLISVRLGQSNSIIDKAITVAGYAFSGCINFATLELNRNITVTGYQSPFITISNLLVGNGVTSIGDQSFRQCVNLPTVTLPITVKFKSYAFALRIIKA